MDLKLLFTKRDLIEMRSDYMKYRDIVEKKRQSYEDDSLYLKEISRLNNIIFRLEAVLIKG